MISSNNRRNVFMLLLTTIMIFTMVHLFVNDVFASDSVAQIYDSTYGQDGNNAAITMNFDTKSFVQSNFTHRTATNSRLYVNETATYKVSYSCVWEAIGGNNLRRIYENKIRVNGATDLVPSESDVYLRGNDAGSQAGGHISSTSATLLVNLTNGDYIELRGGEDSGDTNNGQTDTTNGCFLTAQKLNTRAIEVYDSAGGQNIQTGNGVVVNLDTVYHNSDPGLFVLNNDQVNVSEDGWYKLSYTSCVDQATGTSGNQRESPQSWIRKNGNTNESLSFSYAGYTRRSNGGGDKNCNRVNTLLNLTSGDYLELRTGIFDTENSNTINTIANQGWLILEKVEMDSTIISINNSGQQMDHGVPAAVSFDQNDKLGDYITHTGSSSQIQFDKTGLYELAYNIGYQDSATGDRVITCGYLRENGATILSPSKQCVYTRGDAQARTGTVSTSSIINVTKGDFVEIILNVSGEVGVDDYVQVQKGTTWFTVVKINETPKLNWNGLSFDLGDGNISAGDLVGNGIFNITGEGQTNVDLTCISGDCATITDSWADGTTLIGTDESKTVGFTCSDNVVGSYNATFRINSSQDTQGDTAWISCDINQSYGKLGLVLSNPSVGAFVNVVQNESQLVNATLTCNGATDSYCGNVSLHSRYNHTSVGMRAVNITPGDVPFWTNTSNPKYCNLFNGESCSVVWFLNATGIIGDMYSINVNATSNFSVEVPYNETGNFTINITQVPPGTIIWNLADLSINPGGLNLGDTTSTATILPASDHTYINTTCNQGDCFNITDNWIDGTNKTDGNNTVVTFTCDDGHVGTYWAVFALNSSEDNSPSDINVTCEITQTYGELNVTIDYPPEAQTTQVNYLTQFDINVSVECEGTVGASCGTPDANVRYFEKTLDYGDGSDGELTITTAGMIVNNYTYLTGNEGSGQNNLTVNDGTEFSVGDEVLIIQHQKGLADGTAGQYEFANIASITGAGGNDLILDVNLTNSYGSGTFDTTSASSTQVIRIPQYTMVNVTTAGSIVAPAWNGYTGGIVAFRSRDNVTITGYINVSHLGYRGGDCNGCANNDFGDQGEGTTGTGTSSTAANSNGGGGGDGSQSSGEAGGGGGHGVSGSDGVGTTTATGGNSVGYTNLSQLHFGGGAGAGGDNNARTPLPEYIDGGGIAIVISKNIYSANILAKGETGRYGSSGVNGGVSGSGAGGSIWLAGNYVNVSDVNASGGPAVAGESGDIGGAGGDGRIRIDYLGGVGSSDPASGYTSTNYQEAETVITNAVTDTPFQIIGAQALTCSSEVFVGDTCSLSWSVNVTSSIETTYEINSNASSDEISVPINKSGNATVEINADPSITVISPTNLSKHFDTDTLWANITSTVPIIAAYYYLDGDTSTVYNMSNTSSVDWYHEVVNVTSFGTHNITFLYNKTGVIQNSTEVYTFIYLKNADRRVTKAITSITTNMYLIDILLDNNEILSKNSTLVDFVDSNFTAGSFTPSSDYFDTSFGPTFFGKNYVWNLTLVPLSNNEFNYSIATTGDYEMSKAFIIGLD